MNKLFLIILVLSFYACVLKPDMPSIASSKKNSTLPLVHIVSSNGESLEDISKWYTGKASNWQIISQYNSRKGKLKLSKGESILIPEGIVKNRNPLKFVNKKQVTTKKAPQIPRKVENKNPDKDDLKSEKEIVQKPEKVEPKNAITTSGPDIKNEIIKDKIIPEPVKSPESISPDKKRLELLKELLSK